MWYSIGRFMEDQTFRSRLTLLVQKSRKAVRLYNNVGSISELGGSELTGVQVLEWKNVNSELLRRLSLVVEISNHRRLVAEVFSVRDSFDQEWRSSEVELLRKQSELVSAAEHGDFIRCSALSSSLVVLKARMQAAQAAHHELDLLVKRSRSEDEENSQSPGASPLEAAAAPNRFQQRRDERVLSELGLKDLDDESWFGAVPTTGDRQTEQCKLRPSVKGSERKERIMLGTSQLRDKSILNEGSDEELEQRIAKVIPIQRRS